MKYKVMKAFTGEKEYKTGDVITIKDEDSDKWRNLRNLINCNYLKPVE